jgi:hypothetical protein
MTAVRPLDPRLPASFWAKVSIASDGCWRWIASRNPSGYGKVRHDGQSRLAHRVAYAALVAPIPPGAEIDHRCRVRDCVNPSHLEPVTHEVNTLRSTSPTAKNAVRDECVNGHPFDEANTYRPARGGRMCRTCRRERMRTYAEAKR